MTKAELRTIYLEKRRSLTVQEVSEKSRQIADRFFEGFDLGAVKTLHCFIPIVRHNETDTALICERVWTEFPHVRTVAPRIKLETGEMDHLIFAAKTEVVENPWGIREPADGEAVDVTEIDMVLVPLLCSDRAGHRVGFGKGFYDRFMSRCRPDCLKVGLSFFPPVDKVSDLGPHDIALDHCVTPLAIFPPRTKDVVS